jgi:hypothetical protein
MVSSCSKEFLVSGFQLETSPAAGLFIGWGTPWGHGGLQRKVASFGFQAIPLEGEIFRSLWGGSAAETPAKAASSRDAAPICLFPSRLEAAPTKTEQSIFHAYQTANCKFPKSLAKS